MEDWICINLALILASSTINTANSFYVWSVVAKCFSLWARSLGSYVLEILRFHSTLSILWLVSCVKYDESHNLEYNEKIFSITIFTFSTFLANSTCESLISLDIFSLAFIWNFFLTILIILHLYQGLHSIPSPQHWTITPWWARFHQVLVGWMHQEICLWFLQVFASAYTHF